MTYFGTPDLPTMLADFGVPVVWGAVSKKGIVDVADEELMTTANETFTGKQRTVTVETTPFAALKRGDTITVEGVGYFVITAQQFGDGALTRLLVRPS